ncbi:OmpP1/FadL family transporter [Algibacter miyuki]|uniref:OmpP1/FadL family transporter n=1 Tax=Algibacter miyuki TaxID=1306933 RepID=A0ABV5H3Y6_9FLAO|nr:outer membrane protein transport protein [Algibacter miyuki]MDN3665674.1 transporter [Algibacter miyuki]
MKKLNLLAIGLLSMSNLFAQDISDALRYSQDEIQGTARFRALSGAFGALGGDMSAVSINPAGSAVFSQSHISFSLSSEDKNNTTDYFGNTEKTNDSQFDLNQFGAAFVFGNNNRNSPWRKFTLAIAYDKTKNHNNSWYAEGLNTNDDGNFSNSIASYFYDYADGKRLDQISAFPDESIREAYSDIGSIYGFAHQQAFLGYESYILDAVDESDDGNTLYNANVNSGNFTHRYSYLATGYNGKITFNFATQYEDKLYLGINLNSHFIDYQRETLLLENNTNGGVVTSIDFGNTLATTGRGFSLQLGAIYKITSQLRLGLAYDSPTWYTIEEETTQRLNTDKLYDENVDPINPQIVNIYPEYKLQTPAKYTGSLAYIIGTRGLISFDYSNKNYGNTTFKPEADYTDLNNGIDNVLTSASTYRLGGEYKVKQISFRGGYRFEESPYTDGVTVGDLNGFSLGLGYNFGNTKLDLTFDQAKRSYQTPLYNVGLLDTVDIDQVNSNITLSLNFNI